jgi:hypothetical protein
VTLSRSRDITALVLIVAAALGAASSAVLAREANTVPSASTITLVDGPVLVRHGSAELRPARLGDVVAAGDAVLTATGGSAELTYFDGSSVRVEENAELLVAALRPEADGGGWSGMIRTIEHSWHVVAKLMSGGSRYEVRTPSSTASVRG